MMMWNKGGFKALSLLILSVYLGSCTVGPNYHPPAVQVPAQFKEAPKGWKKAKPMDEAERGNWWQLFKDPELNALLNRLNVSNQTIAVAAANYQQALALIDQARASYFPTLTGAVSLTRQKRSSSSGTVFNSV